MRRKLLPKALFLGIAFLLSAAIALVACETRETKSMLDDDACVLHAYYDSGVGGCFLTFMKDRTCEWNSGFDDLQKGGYSIKDSLITLTGIEPSRALKSTLLLITKKNPHQAHLGNEILLQVDHTGTIADSTLIFTIDKDRR